MKPPLLRLADDITGTLLRIAGYFALLGVIIFGGGALIGGELRNILADESYTAWMLPKTSLASAQGGVPTPPTTAK